MDFRNRDLEERILFFVCKSKIAGSPISVLIKSQCNGLINRQYELKCSIKLFVKGFCNVHNHVHNNIFKLSCLTNGNASEDKVHR